MIAAELVPYAVGAVVLLWWMLKPAAKLAARRPALPLGKPPAIDWVGTLKAEAPRTGQRYLIVGCGSLGKRIVKTLRERGETKIRCFDVAVNPLDADDAECVEYVRGDVTDRGSLEKAFVGGVDVVYSTFAVLSYTQRLMCEAARSERVNVGGTQTLIDVVAAQPRPPLLVYTSTSHVVLTNANSWGGVAPDIPKFDEATPLVHRGNAVNHYAWTKAAAEAAVCEAAAAGRIKAVCIRPSGVFGARDGLLLEKGFAEGMKHMVDPVRQDFIYVDNLVFALLLAEKHLALGTAGMNGEAFNVTNGEDPCHLGDLSALAFAHVKAVPGVPLLPAPACTDMYLPPHFMSLLSRGVELLQILTFGRVTPYLGERAMLTPALFLVSRSSYSMTDAKARARFGYHAVYTVEEGCAQAAQEYAASLQNSKKQR